MSRENLTIAEMINKGMTMQDIQKEVELYQQKLKEKDLYNKHLSEAREKLIAAYASYMMVLTGESFDREDVEDFKRSVIEPIESTWKRVATIEKNMKKSAASAKEKQCKCGDACSCNEDMEILNRSINILSK